MNRRLLQILRVCGAAASCVLVVAAVHGQGVEDQLDRIAADWKKRQERIERVRYRISGEAVSPREAVVDDSGKPIKSGGESTIKVPIRWTLLLDFRTNRHRLEIENHVFRVNENRFVRSESVISFDGRHRWAITQARGELRTRSAPVDLHISSGDFRAARIESNMYPPFFGHGIVPYSGAGRLYPGSLVIEPSTESLMVHGEVIHDGRRCLVLRTPASQGIDLTYDELWVDLSRDSAVVRHAFCSNKNAKVDTFIWYRQTTHGWLPERWERTIRGSQRTLEISRVRVESLDINPPVTDADFRLEEKPGMLIRTSVNPPWDERRSDVPPEATKVRYFRVDESGHRREVVFEGGVEKDAGRNRWKWWLLAAGGVVCMLILVYLVGRRRTAHST